MHCQEGATARNMGYQSSEGKFAHTLIRSLRSGLPPGAAEWEGLAILVALVTSLSESNRFAELAPYVQVSLHFDDSKAHCQVLVCQFFFCSKRGPFGCHKAFRANSTEIFRALRHSVGGTASQPTGRDSAEAVVPRGGPGAGTFRMKGRE